MNESTERLVVIVEPDLETRREIVRQLSEAELPTRDYRDGESFLTDLGQLQQPSFFCLVSEMRLGGVSGVSLLRQLALTEHIAAVVFYVHSMAIREVVRAMRDGAIAVVEKNDGITGLLAHVEEALEVCREEFRNERELQRNLQQLRALNVGEQQVLCGIMTGKLNKEIAQELNLSIRTIEQRRRSIFRKLDVKHPASLACKVMGVTQAQAIQQPPADGWTLDAHIKTPLQPPHHWRRRAFRTPLPRI